MDVAANRAYGELKAAHWRLRVRSTRISCSRSLPTSSATDHKSLRRCGISTSPVAASFAQLGGRGEPQLTVQKITSSACRSGKAATGRFALQKLLRQPCQTTAGLA